LLMKSINIVSSARNCQQQLSVCCFFELRNMSKELSFLKLCHPVKTCIAWDSYIWFS
jgi:hypothetical protein